MKHCLPLRHRPSQTPIASDRRRRERARMHYAKLQQLRRARCKPHLPQELRQRLLFLLQEEARTSSPQRLSNRCVFTGKGRGRGTSLAHLSQVTLRAMARSASLPGIRKV